MQCVDVVMVPDFGGTARRLFEVRTLLFLGSWLEHEGASRSWPLHLAVVGDPPPGVLQLADRCGARVSRHAALECGGERFLNKLRGLEVESRSGQILLLDADTVILGDLAPASALGNCLAALTCPGNFVCPAVFEEVFAVAGVKMPSERELPLIGQLADRLPAATMRTPFSVAVPPYFNSGVVLAPASCGLRAHWEALQRLLFDQYSQRGDDYKHLARGDQYSLSLAMAQLREEGVPYHALPYELHGLDILYAAGVLTYEQTRIYHAKSLFRRVAPGVAFDPVGEIDRYERSQLERMYAEGRIRGALRRLRGKPHPKGAGSMLALCRRLRELARRYVEPALERRADAAGPGEAETT